MCVALVGGMDRLKRHYVGVADEMGIMLRHFEASCTGLEEKIGGADAIVIFTDKISHDARNRALSRARSSGKPVLMCHSCGISSLRRCLTMITEEKCRINNKEVQ